MAGVLVMQLLIIGGGAVIMSDAGGDDFELPRAPDFALEGRSARFAAGAVARAVSG
jgi:hypothetical protein